MTLLPVLHCSGKDSDSDSESAGPVHEATFLPPFLVLGHSFYLLFILVFDGITIGPEIGTRPRPSVHDMLCCLQALCRCLRTSVAWNSCSLLCLGLVLSNLCPPTRAHVFGDFWGPLFMYGCRTHGARPARV